MKKENASNIMELTDEIKKTPIEILAEKKVSSDNIKTLLSMGIKTIGQLLNASVEEIYDATKINYGSEYYKIRESLIDMGLFFHEDHLKWEKAGISDEMAMIKFEKLDISNSLKNALYKNHCMCLGDLLVMDYKEIQKLRGIGETGLIEIKNYIHSLGFSFSNEELTVEEARESFKEKGILMIEESLDLDPNVARLLYRNGIYTLQDLIKVGTEVYNLVGMGNVKKQALMQALQDKNITLKSTSILQKDAILSLKPSEAIINKSIRENKKIKDRIDYKEKVLSKYEKTIKEREALIAKEKRLDEQIAQISLLITQQKEEGTNYGRK